MITKVLVPGNLFLCGEYAITCPDGLGVALALAPTLELRSAPAPVFSFSGSAGGTPLNGESLVRAALAVVIEETGARKDDLRLAYAFSADSHAFYAPGGRKLGYGSSAALMVALVTAFMSALGMLGAREQSRGDIARLALAAHRLYQGGGSGYDVYASVYGGLGLFTGGNIPEWEPLPPAGLPRFCLIQGRSAERSGTAVRSFTSWRGSAPEDAAHFVQSSNEAACALARGIHSRAAEMREGWPEALAPSPGFLSALEAAREVGLKVGRILGRDPEPPLFSSGESLLDRVRAAGFAAKASGAGAELAFAFRTSPPYTSTSSVPDRVCAADDPQWACSIADANGVAAGQLLQLCAAGAEGNGIAVSICDAGLACEGVQWQ
jgi:phosphomevalonate kinase